MRSLDQKVGIYFSWFCGFAECVSLGSEQSDKMEHTLSYSRPTVSTSSNGHVAKGICGTLN